MTLNEIESNERVNKILAGLELAYEKLLEEKKAKNRKLVILRDNKIMMIKPEELNDFEQSDKFS
jgi:hypothetical protein